MSSDKVGVQALIRQEAPLAGYMHCSGHALNLVIASSCRQVEIRSMIDKLKAVCSFFLFSPMREGLLLDIVQRSAIHPSKRKPRLTCVPLVEQGGILPTHTSISAMCTLYKHWR